MSQPPVPQRMSASSRSKVVVVEVKRKRTPAPEQTAPVKPNHRGSRFDSMPWNELVALDRQIKALLAEIARQEQRDKTWREKRVRIADIANRAGANLGNVRANECWDRSTTIAQDRCALQPIRLPASTPAPKHPDPSGRYLIQCSLIPNRAPDPTTR